jgi:SAM-dependent methyltransferase
MTGIFSRFHEGYVHNRRATVLSERLSLLLSPNASVLDVGAGDGLLARKLLSQRPDLTITAVDVVLRSDTHIDVQAFDGTHLPYPVDSFDSVLLVDVLHHAERPVDLLKETCRVARRSILIKDSVVRGVGAKTTLNLMEYLANRRHGIRMPERFWTPAEWRDAFADLELKPDSYSTRLGLYPFPANCVFERGFHFLARLQVPE